MQHAVNSDLQAQLTAKAVDQFVLQQQPMHGALHHVNVTAASTGTCGSCLARTDSLTLLRLGATTGVLA